MNIFRLVRTRNKKNSILLYNDKIQFGKQYFISVHAIKVCYISISFEME